MRRKVFWFSLLVPWLWQCQKDPEPETTNVSVPIEWVWEGGEFRLDSTYVLTSAGWEVTISRLDFYLSDPTCLQGASSHTFFRTTYHSLFDPTTHNLEFQFEGNGGWVPSQFYFGVADLRNLTGYFPNTKENLGMAWPDPMGGGYHHIKLEGRIRHQGKYYPFAFHTGLPVTAHLVQPDPTTHDVFHVQLRVNIDRWFEGLDPTQDPLYTMGDAPSMNDFQDRSQNVFSWSQKP